MYGNTPRGHSGENEGAGVIAEPGRGWQAGERGAVGRFGSNCGHRPACRRGNVVHCQERRAPGLSYPGGWSTTPTVPASALTRVPRPPPASALIRLPRPPSPASRVRPHPRPAGLSRTEATSSGRAAAVRSSTGGDRSRRGQVGDRTEPGRGTAPAPRRGHRGRRCGAGAGSA
ncbi:alcohol dehydrogenase catalytic domain-containing protein [Streptomyces tricolor]|uniref:alcohol dehydrogenase catalytic domain-containing protein n=1 Tax=Streptomyces tricolor TaxID=68277 RepID=UPI00380B7826